MHCSSSCLSLILQSCVVFANFAVLRHTWNIPLVEGRVDPIVSPGGPSAHVHTVMGASNFGFSSNGHHLISSQCTTAMVKGDLSAYWFPKLYFQDPHTDSFEPVDMYYMNVYYFFGENEETVLPFPIGLQMISGNATLRTYPGTAGLNLDPANGPIQPAQWSCPRLSSQPLSYPPNSDGISAGVQDLKNPQAGVGFPFAKPSNIKFFDVLSNQPPGMYMPL
ncbi:hypothetical protein HYQ46_003832 [Verticillium longisporum]|nr:hypothetical protein HYQ46_003832 [Verticillium longisporum]